MRRALVLLVALGLSACGAANRLQPPKGEQLPVAPRGATVRPPAQAMRAPRPPPRRSQSRRRPPNNARNAPTN